MLAKAHALVYVQRDGLVVAGKHVIQGKLTFPKDLVANMEVIDVPQLIDCCRQFFNDHHLRHKRVLMVLDSSLVFRKKIELDVSGQPDTLTEAFVAAMPFEPGSRACITIQSDKLLQLLATNATLYDTIVQALDASDAGKLVAVVPVAAFNLDGVERKISVLTERFLNDKEAVKLADFTSVQPL